MTMTYYEPEGERRYRWTFEGCSFLLHGLENSPKHFCSLELLDTARITVIIDT